MVAGAVEGEGGGKEGRREGAGRREEGDEQRGRDCIVGFAALLSLVGWREEGTDSEFGGARVLFRQEDPKTCRKEQQGLFREARESQSS
jgi:hypothetical protein